jgi:nucleotide-binding universal stress UspA family protein
MKESGMSYKNIAVCLDTSESASLRLQFALELALHHDANLLGFHLTPPPMIMPDPYTAWATQMREIEESEDKKQELAMQQFRSSADKAGVKFNCVRYRSDAVAKIIAHTRLSDITLIGQHLSKELGLGFANSFTKTLILKIGRPVLVLPNMSKNPSNIRSIVIAWDGGREATRAIADAMPFLQNAKKVHLLSIKEKNDKEYELPGIDIASYLTKHNVNVDVEISDTNETSASDLLLLRAARNEADLIVMGAYGHHRITELILGGMTHDILKKANLPVLMSY